MSFTHTEKKITMHFPFLSPTVQNNRLTQNLTFGVSVKAMVKVQCPLCVFGINYLFSNKTPVYDVEP